MPPSRLTRPAASRVAALSLVVCAALSLPAHAGQEEASETTERIGVLEVATYGVSKAAGDKFEQSVEETLAGVGFSVVRSQTVQQKLAGTNYIAGCTFGPCMKEVLSKTGLRRVLVARIQGAGQSYSVVVSLVETQNGYLVSQAATSCPVCTVEEAIATATLAVVELLTDRKEGARAAPVEVRRSDDAGPARRLELRRRQARRMGWSFVAGGAVAAGLGGLFLAMDRESAGLAAGGLGVGFGVAGLSALVWSKSF